MVNHKWIGELWNFSESWKSLLWTILTFRVLAFCLLSPLFSLLVGIWLAVSGNQVLTDVDIALVLVKPLGLLVGLVVASVWLTLVALEQAALLGVLAATSQGAELRPTRAILFAGLHGWPVLRVAFRLLVVILLLAIPLVVSLGLIYYSLLSEHDINFFLAEKPPGFYLALALGVVVGLVFGGVLLRIVSGWFLALPLVLFEPVVPRDSLRVSAAHIRGNRTLVFMRLAAWLALVVMAQLLLAGFLSATAAWLVPNSIGSLPVLVARVGGMLLVLAIVSAALNIFATMTFAVILFGAYRHFFPDWKTSVGRVRDDLAGEIQARRWLTRRRLAAAILVAGLIVAVIGLQSLDELTLEDDTLVMAHRGSSIVAPENSLAAIQQAIADQADWVEIDVQETSDGEVVVVHDSDLMKMSRNPVKIWNASLAELQQIDIGSWKSAQFSKERVPTLGQVLALCRDRIGVVIELKYYGHDQQLEQRVVDLVEQHNMAEQVMVMSLKPEGVKKVKALRPKWKCGVLLSVSVGKLDRIEADFLAINAKFATRRLIQQVHRSGREIYTWTVDEPALMSTLMNRGVDGILTNRPEVARQVLASRAEMGVAERLLTELASILRVNRDQVLEEH